MRGVPTENNALKNMFVIIKYFEKAIHYTKLIMHALKHALPLAPLQVMVQPDKLASTGKAVLRAEVVKARRAMLLRTTASIRSLCTGSVLMPAEGAAAAAAAAGAHSCAEDAELHSAGLDAFAAYMDKCRDQPACRQSKSGMFLLTASNLTL